MRGVLASSCWLLLMFCVSAQAEQQKLLPSDHKPIKLPETASRQIEKKLAHQLLLPGDSGYPLALAEKGVQGETKLAIQLNEAGMVSEVTVMDSSKSIDLDNAALAYVRSPNWKLPIGVINESPRSYVQEFIFRKDSSLSVDKKTCADFNRDLAYFQSAHADKTLSKMPVFELLAGMFTVRLMKTSGSETSLKYVRSVAVIDQATAKACQAKPKALLLKTYVKAVNRNGIKF